MSPPPPKKKKLKKFSNINRNSTYNSRLNISASYAVFQEFLKSSWACNEYNFVQISVF